MAKTKVSQWDSVAANNTDINAININEGCPPSTINNAIREVMAQIKDWQDGSSGDSWTSGGTLNITGSLQLDGSIGSNGQVLKSVGSTATPVWATLGTMSTQNSNAVNITGGSVKTTGDLNVTGALKLDNSVGSSGQVLVSSGSSATPTWGDAFVTGMIMLWSGSTGTVPSGWRLCDGGGGTPNLMNRFVVGAGSSYAVNATGGSANATLVSHSHTLSGTAAASSISGTAAASAVSGTTGAGGGHNHTASTSVATKTGLNGTLTLLNRGGDSGSQSLMRARSGSVTTATSGQGNYGTGWRGEGGSNSSKATFALDHNHSATTTNTAVGNHTHTMSGTAAASSVSGTAAASSISGTAVATGSSATNANLPPYYALAYIMKL